MEVGTVEALNASAVPWGLRLMSVWRSNYAGIFTTTIVSTVSGGWSLRLSLVAVGGCRITMRVIDKCRKRL